MRMIKIFKTLFYTSLVLILCVIFLEIILNFFKNERNDNRISLHESEYYQNKYLSDPYIPYVVQYIHPYYMFSLPWQESNLNNLPFKEIVGINKDGFRKIQNKNISNILLLLGGSTAFGHFARNDQGAIGSYLNTLNDLQVVNRNAPSWNSHQELISVLKFEKLEDVKISITITLANDVSNICFERINSNTEEYLDFPESWDKLNHLVSDIRLRYVSRQTLRTLTNWFKEFLVKKNFPNITNLISNINNDDNLTLTKLNTGNINLKEAEIVLGNCDENHINAIVNSFLENQNKIKKLSEIYGFKHYTIIQPHFSLHKNSNIEQRRNINEIAFRKMVIERVLKSSFCNSNNCIDLSTFFDNFDQNLFIYSADMDKNNAWFENGFFVDEYHFTDLGNKKIAEEINIIIN